VQYADLYAVVSWLSYPETIAIVKLSFPMNINDKHLYFNCLLRLMAEIYEGNLGNCPLPFESYTIYIHGLSSQMRHGMHKFFSELQDLSGGVLTCGQSSKSNFICGMANATVYLNWLDNEGFKVVGHNVDSSVYSGGVTKSSLWTLQM